MRFIYGLSWFLIYVIRAFVLWILIPYAVLAWLFVHSWVQKSTIGQSLCWYDQNFLAFMILVPFRYLRFVNPKLRSAKFLRLSEMRVVKTYRISFLSEMV